MVISSFPPVQRRKLKPLTGILPLLMMKMCRILMPSHLVKRQQIFIPLLLVSGEKLYTGCSSGFICGAADNRNFEGYISVCHFNGLFVVAFMRRTLCKIHHAPHCAASKISKQMAELDFSWSMQKKGRDDELGSLAHNLNSLSASLSTALKDLQIANRQLRTDIERSRNWNVKGGFLSAASHELKHLTILKGHLMGCSTRLKDMKIMREYMVRSLAVVDKMEALVKRIAVCF